MTRRHLTVLLVPSLTFAALALVGCGEARVHRDVATAVRAYQDALSLAYRTGEIAPLARVATPAEVKKVVVLLDLKRDSGVVLESALVSFAVRDARRSADTGFLVRTRERWRYQDRPVRPGQVGGPVFVADMEMEYLVAQEGAAWKVASNRTVSSEFLEPKGFHSGK